MAQLKNQSKITGEVTVSGKVYAKGDTTDLTTKINNNYNKIVTMLGRSTIPCTMTTDGTANSTPTAYLIGNTLRLNFNITWPESLSGNMDNVKIATYRLTHNGKIKTVWATVCNDAGYGGQTAMYTGHSTIDANTSEVTLHVSATCNSCTRLAGWFTAPVTLNPDAF